MMKYMNACLTWLFIGWIQCLINIPLQGAVVIAKRTAGLNKGSQNNKRSNQDGSKDCEGSQVEKQSFLWTLKDSEPPTYFYGTIHVPYTQVWQKIPENVKQSFNRADQVHFELDLMDPFTVSTLAKCQLLPQGEVLSNVIPTNLYKRLKRHLNYIKDVMPNWMTSEQQGRGLYADYLFNAITGNWERKRPIWVMLMVNSLTESDIKARGIPVLDLYLAQEARRLGKKTGGVEDVSEQCIPLNGLNFSQVLFALNQTLRQHEHYREGSSHSAYTTDHLIHHYNCGQLDNMLISHDTAQVPNLVFNVNSSLPSRDLVIARQIDQYFRQELIFKRNYRMANRIIRLLRNNPNDSFFFAFGAGHFVGNHTIIDILRRKGYNIENTRTTEKAYMGNNYKEKKLPPLLADVHSDFPLPPVVIHGNIDYTDTLQGKRNPHRHRHNRRRNRKRNRDRHDEDTEAAVSTNIKPHFKDLWVRIERTSEQPQSSMKSQRPTAAVSGQKVEYVYIENKASNARTSTTFLVLLILLVCIS